MSQQFINPFGVNVPLSPDMDVIYDKLQAQVTNDGDIERIWTDLITAATGGYILRMVSSFTADLAFAVERAQQEVMLATARRPSSVYAIAGNHGVHLQRKIPGSVSVRITRSATDFAKRIPAYSQWEVGSVAHFNREEIIFPEGASNITITLHRGTVQEDVVISTGRANQSFIIDVGAFRVSDADLFCEINGAVWESSKEGLWEKSPLTRAFVEKTTIDGKVRIWFGDGVYGAIPPAGEIIFKYVIVQTSDYDASKDLNPIAIGSVVTCASDADIRGLTAGERSAIQVEQPPEFYQRNAPYIASGRKRANNRKNLRAIALTYPGVIDVRLLGQAEINPKDLRWMNGIAAYVLTSTEWGAVSWNHFIAFMHSNSDSTRHFYRRTPEKVVVDYTINMSLAQRAREEDVKSRIKKILQGVYALSDQSLGARYDTSSVGKKILDGLRDGYGNLVTFMEIVAPKDIELNAIQYAVLGDVHFNTKTDRKNMVKVVNGSAVPGGRIGIMG